MKKIAFLVPSNERCGVHDYSTGLFSALKSYARKEPFQITLVKYDNSNNFLYYFNLAGRLSKKFDLIHLQHEFALFGKFGLGFFFFLLGVKKPLAVTFHEFHPAGLLGAKESFLLLMKNKISKAVVLSNFAEKQAKVFFNSKKVENTSFGATQRTPSAKVQKNLIVHPGFIRENKNQLFTLGLAAMHPEYEFVFAGSGQGAYFEQVNTASSTLKNARITGFLPPKKYFELLSKAAVVILPYASVVQSAVFFDALSLKKKIVCSDIKFFQQFEKLGLCACAPLNENAFFEGIKRQIRRKGPKRIADYLKDNSLAAVAGRNLRVYEGVLNG